MLGQDSFLAFCSILVLHERPGTGHNPTAVELGVH